MDTSKEYILMSEKAVKIQEHEPAAWDYYYLLEDRKHPWDGVFVLSGYTTDGGYYGPDPYVLMSDSFKFHKRIWLPRQDQLQGMVCDEYRLQMPGFIVNDLNIWCQANLLAEYRSMEQLWLALVQKTNHNEFWNGEDWIIEANTSKA